MKAASKTSKVDNAIVEIAISTLSSLWLLSFGHPAQTSHNAIACVRPNIHNFVYLA